mgnify:CR=1 FL=1
MIATIMTEKNIDEGKATQIGCQLVDAGLLRHVVDVEKPLRNSSSSLYRFYKVHTAEEISEEISLEWVQQTVDFMLNSSGWEQKDANKSMGKHEFTSASHNMTDSDLKAVKVTVVATTTMDQLMNLLDENMIERHGGMQLGFTRFLTTQNGMKHIQGEPTSRSTLVESRYNTGNMLYVSTYHAHHTY